MAPVTEGYGLRSQLEAQEHGIYRMRNIPEDTGIVTVGHGAYMVGETWKYGSHLKTTSINQPLREDSSNGTRRRLYQPIGSSSLQSKTP